MSRLLALLVPAGLALCACEPSSSNPATDADAGRAVAVAEAFLEAINRSDTAALRLHAAPGARLVALADDPTAEPRITAIDDFIERIQADSGRFVERMWAPQVHVDDRLATVWPPYDFYRDRELSHCGTDSFDLVRMGRAWKVLSIVYTVHPEDCESSPLGPLR